MATNFTTWTELKQAILNDVRNRLFSASYSMAGRSVTYSNRDEALRWLQECDRQIAQESDSSYNGFVAGRPI